ncbi:MAG TPA: DHA2 family efflux MFS transporter permease subunit, partial [Caulobacteraceae bacterium]
APVLDTKRGKQILMLLLAVAFLDFVDASIVNVALPSIRSDLGFSLRNLQWVLTGYLLTYGGLMLLGGRASDLFGRRRLLIAGTVLFAFSSLASGLAPDATVLIVARMIQGAGAAMMIPAALSILTTTFSEPGDRYKAMGAWGAVGGLASAVGVFLGGVITEFIDWRWVFFVNLPAAALILRAIFRLVPTDERVERRESLDVLGALLVTAGMLLLVYTIVEAPNIGWSDARTIAGFAVAGVILAIFVGYEANHRNPVFPFSIFRVKGLAAADVTMVTAMAGFYTMFLFITLYLQNVLGLSKLEAGCAYLPPTLGVVIAAGIATNLMGRVGTRPVIVGGAILGAGGVFWLSKIPVDGSYWANVLPALVLTALGLGGVLVGTTTAAQNGVSPDKAGLAAALINSSMWLGGALGVAIFSAVATSTTAHRLAEHASQPDALTAGFQDALLLAAIFLAAAAVIALRSPNTHGQQAAPPAAEPTLEPATEAA